MTRRMMLVVLALMGLMVLVATVSGPPQGGSGGESAATPAPGSPQLSDPDAFDVSATLSAAPSEREQTVKAELGDRVQIVVEGDVIDSVALGELSTKTLEEDLPARFELLAETPGTYPLVLVNENRRIGALEIR
jgi:hypothetical protein